MSQLIVRKLPPDLVRKLKLRAAEHGVSAEEEHRRILHEALTGSTESKPSLIEFIAACPAAADVELPLDRSREIEDRPLSW
ncbi:FitA-like ribbon-helix-helix domain-containing protein [Haloferula sp. A504]|uniref:FitA-like ribbon-helix-helix domain-containing protein n=1 Tax=Haloferula sp. A504 TaxID=3373601 RepID=UPI0031C84AD6|nr:hypothetical protein [Verrucomicrobiaceae bacterium E54]